MSGAVPPLLLNAFMACTDKSFFNASRNVQTICLNRVGSFELKNSWERKINCSVFKSAAVRSCGDCGTKTALKCHVVAT